MVSFDKILEWQKRIKAKRMDTKRLFIIARVLYGKQEKVSLVRGEKGNMKKAVVAHEYSINDFDTDIENFISNSEAVTCPKHIITSLQLMEALNG